MLLVKYRLTPVSRPPCPKYKGAEKSAVNNHQEAFWNRYLVVLTASNVTVLGLARERSYHELLYKLLSRFRKRELRMRTLNYD